jgi:hypothetical protein
MEQVVRIKPSEATISIAVALSGSLHDRLRIQSGLG